MTSPNKSTSLFGRFPSSMFLFFTLIVFNGCLLIPAIESVNQMGISPTSRLRLLTEDVKKFQEAIYWGRVSEALRYVQEDSREEIARQLDGLGDEERIVESKIKSAEFVGDSSFTAEVNINTRYFRVPFYNVIDRKESQTWVFNVGSGWKLVTRELSEKGKSPQGANPRS